MDALLQDESVREGMDLWNLLIKDFFDAPKM